MIKKPQIFTAWPPVCNPCPTVPEDPFPTPPTTINPWFPQPPALPPTPPQVNPTFPTFAPPGIYLILLDNNKKLPLKSTLKHVR